MAIPRVDLDEVPLYSSGARFFIELLDCPDEYLPGTAGYVVTVNNTEDGLVFLPASGGSFDPTVDEDITGEWTFEVVSGKSFLVSDAPSTPKVYFGILNHIAPFTSAILGANAYIDFGVDVVGSFWQRLDSGEHNFQAPISNPFGNGGFNQTITDTGVTEFGSTHDKLTLASTDGSFKITFDSVTVPNATSGFIGFDDGNDINGIQSFSDPSTGEFATQITAFDQSTGTSAYLGTIVEPGLAIVVSLSDAVQFAGIRYADLAAIDLKIPDPQTDMFVMVIGVGLATYNGSAWVLASDDFTPIA